VVDTDLPYKNIFSCLVHDTLMNTFEIIEANRVTVIHSYKNLKWTLRPVLACA